MLDDTSDEAIDEVNGQKKTAGAVFFEVFSRSCRPDAPDSVEPNPLYSE